MDKKKVVVWAACTDASGSPTLVSQEVSVTDDEFEEGDHYELAKEALEDVGYEGPFVCFDPMETQAIVNAAAEIVAVAKPEADDDPPFGLDEAIYAVIKDDDLSLYEVATDFYVSVVAAKNPDDAKKLALDVFSKEDHLGSLEALNEAELYLDVSVIGRIKAAINDNDGVSVEDIVLEFTALDLDYKGGGIWTKKSDGQTLDNDDVAALLIKAVYLEDRGDEADLYISGMVGPGFRL